MKRITIKQFLHDGYVFHYADEAITSVEVKDPRAKPLSDDEIENGVEVKFDYKAFMEGAQNTEQANQPDSGLLKGGTE